MSEPVAVIIALILVISVLSGIAWLIRAALREQTDAMQEITGDASLLNREKHNAR